MFAKTLKGALCSLWGALLLLGTGNSYAEYPINLVKGVTDISHKVYDLHMLIFYICCAIGAVVFGVMIWSMSPSVLMGNVW